ncbi:hypothetical protein ACFFV7_07265 [Nonomuraea spiralis]|uniref:Uncharacterized protein n=1 Tax=Nonomuraea spiralis TaxID=46182 RepID=A0ABV5I8W1_9ACTN|nr:hypothetical protein [Nonomuraea spiralis]
MFVDRPQLAVEILRDLMGVDLPDTPLVRQEDRTFNTRPSDDIEPDITIVLGPPQSPAHAIIVEVQHDKSKEPRQLARYAASLWLMLKCDVTVLVVCPDRATAAHYSRPIDSGLTGYRLQACVLGPGDVPAITDPYEAAAHLELAVMSVMIHGRDRKVVEAFTAALAETRDEHAPKYSEYAYSMSVPEIRRILEEIMTSTAWPVYSPFARQHYGRGRAEGIQEGRAEGIQEGRAEGIRETWSESVLYLLVSRGIDVPEDVRARISACTDVDLVKRWALRAASVQAAQDVFDDSDEQRR